MTQTDSPGATLIEPSRVFWFVDPSTTPPTPLRFVRDPDGGALAIGGPTGSHLTGHAELWWDKLTLIASQGYIPAELAIKKRLIPDSWSAPAFSEADKRILSHIQSRTA